MAPTLDTVQASSRLGRTMHDLRAPHFPRGLTFSVAIRVRSFLRLFISFSCRNVVCTCILWAVIRSDRIWSTKHSTHILDDVSDGDRRDWSRQFSHDWEVRELVRQDEVVSPFDFENVSRQYIPCCCWHFTCDHRFLAVHHLAFLAYSAIFCHFVILSMSPIHRLSC